MKLVYWILATVLVAGMAAYSTARDSSGICEVPHSTAYRVFR
jgi:hypothetical protein